MNVNVTARGASRHKNCPTHTSLSASLLGQLKRIRRGPRDGRRSTERTLVSNYCRGRACVTETRGNASCDDRRHTRQCKTGVYIYTPTCRGTCSACMTHCAHRGAHRIFFQVRAIGGGRGQWLGGTMASAKRGFAYIRSVWGCKTCIVRTQCGDAALSYTCRKYRGLCVGHAGELCKTG